MATIEGEEKSHIPMEEQFPKFEKIIEREIERSQRLFTGKFSTGGKEVCAGSGWR